MARIDRIYLDMDGVMVGFDRACLRLFGKPVELARQVDRWAMEESLAKLIGVSADAVWDRINAVGESFWADMEKLPWCDELVQLCHRYGPLTILTTPSYHGSSAAGKIKWLQRYFGNDFRDYVLAPHKYHLAQPNAVLIDDRTKNVEEWEARGGIPLLFPASHNHLRDIDNPLEHVAEELEVIRNG